MLSRNVRQTNQANLPLVSQLGQNFNRGVKGYDRIRDMQLINVDAILSQSLEAAFNGFPQVCRSRVMGPFIWPWTIPAALSRNHQSLWIRKQGFGNQFLADVRTIRIRRIDEVGVQLYGATQNRECSVPILRRAPDALAGETHSSEAKAMDRKLASCRGELFKTRRWDMLPLRFSARTVLRALFVVAVVASAIAVNGCGTAKQTANAVSVDPAKISAQYLYAWKPTEPGTAVDCFRIDGDGTLTSVGVVVQSAQQLNLMVADPRGQFVYWSAPDAVVSFRVQKNSGRLGHAFTASLPSGLSALTMTVNPAGTPPSRLAFGPDRVRDAASHRSGRTEPNGVSSH
jgi:hypothetical protein